MARYLYGVLIMEIRRFYSKRSSKRDGAFKIEGDEAHHIIKVLRYKIGYKLVVFDGTGNDYDCSVSEIGKDYVIARIDCVTPNDTDPKVTLRLYQCITKPDKMDTIVQKAVELGVSEIVPVLTARSEKSVNQEKLERVAVSAAKQCGASRLPTIKNPVTLDEIGVENLLIFAYEGEKSRTLRDVSLAKFTRIDLLVGPEGGFTEGEAETIAEKGALTVSLGKRILRAETASIMLCGLVLYKAGVI